MSGFGNEYYEIQNYGNNFPKRRIVVGLENKTTKQRIAINAEYNEVAINVSLERAFGNIDPRASVDICNLSESTINDFMTFQFAPQNPNEIYVYAGYETVGQKTTKLPLLFKGDIIWAIPTQTRPDTWFHIDCVENFFGLNTTIKPMYGKYSYTANAFEIIQQCLGDVFKLDFSFFDLLAESSESRFEKYNKVIKNFQIPEYITVKDFLNQEVYSFSRMSAFFDGGQLRFVPCSEDLDFLQNVSTTNSFISAESDPPMIGDPKPNPTGVDLVTLFPRTFGSEENPVVVGKSFNLKSRFFSSFNKKYWIQKIKFNLQNRGNAFYCNITSRRSK